MSGHLLWGYANIAFDLLLIFIIRVGIAIRELVLLRRYDRAEERDEIG